MMMCQRIVLALVIWLRAVIPTSAASDEAPIYPAISALYANYQRVPANVLQRYLVNFANEPEHQENVRSVALEGFAKAANCHEPEHFAWHEIVHLYGAVTPNFPLVLDAQGNFLRGIISERGTVSGCGMTMVVNIHTLRRNGAITSVFGIPGTTHGAPIINTGALLFLDKALASHIGRCRKVRYVQADFVGFIGDPNPNAAIQLDEGRPWEDNYTVDICGQKFVVPVDHTPGPSVVQYKVGTPSAIGGTASPP
jgi:hypothetical protein